MKTPAAIASLTIVGSLAYAAGQGTTPPQQLLIRSDRSARTSLNDNPFQQIQRSGDCPDGNRLEWFAPTPHLIPCVTGATFVVGHGDSNPDVDSDGMPDYWSNVATSVLVVDQGVATGSTFEIEISRLDSETGSSVRDFVRIAPANFGDWLLASFPTMTTCVVSFAPNPPTSGWRDMDADGDLDFILDVYAPGTTDTPGYFQIWFENTGHQKQPRIVGDLNGDGKVNGADLGTLLVNWTP